MAGFIEGISATKQAMELADQYLTPQEKVSMARFHEVYEWAKENLDPDFQGISFAAFTKAYEEEPEGCDADARYWSVVTDILLSGRFGQIE